MIDIANALSDGGYSEDRAIPIAISQGKEWYESASEEELKAFDEEKSVKNDSHDTSDTNPDLLDEDVVVSYDDDKEEWSVKSVKAGTRRRTYKYKTDALERAEEI